MFIGPRNESAIRSEVEAVEEYCQRVFNIEVDYPAFREQVRQIIQTRIQDYIFQRFRDWPIPDLLKLETEVHARSRPVKAKKPAEVKPE